jgi:hypothetical protein
LARFTPVSSELIIIDEALFLEAEEDGVCYLFFDSAFFEKREELAPTLCASTKGHKRNGLCY